MKNKKTTIFLLTFFFLLAAAFMTYYYKVNREQPKRLPLMGDQEGKTVTNDDVNGKIYAVEYFFTTCKGICPKMNENMAEVYQAFRGNKDVLILSHTVDPVKDSVKAMKAYSLKYDADPNQWLFLTGDKKELYDMARYSYLVTASDDTGAVDIKSDFIHTDRFVLVDGTGHIRGQYKGTDKGAVAQMIGDIKELLKEE